MALTNKLIADYTELFNQNLDGISIENVEHFDQVSKDLKEIISSFLINEEKKVYENTNKNLQISAKVEDIKELLEEPENYVANQEDYIEFQKILLNRVASKVNEIVNMSINDKENYIHSQQQKKKDAIEHQKHMKQYTAPSPGEERHTLTEEESLRQQYSDQLEEERRQIENLPYAGLTALGISQQAMFTLRNHMTETGGYAEKWRALLQTLETNYPTNIPDEIINFIEYILSNNSTTLIHNTFICFENGVSLETIIGLDEEKREVLLYGLANNINRFNKNNLAIENNLIIDFDKVLDITQNDQRGCDKLSVILKDYTDYNRLIPFILKIKANIQELMELELEKLRYIYDYGNSVKKALEKLAEQNKIDFDFLKNSPLDKIENMVQDFIDNK